MAAWNSGIQPGTAGVGSDIASLAVLAYWRLRDTRAPAPSTEERSPLARRITAMATNAIAVFLIAAAIFITLVSIGIISRPASEDFTFGG
jgi:hypothetical protein